MNIDAPVFAGAFFYARFFEGIFYAHIILDKGISCEF